MLTQDRLKQLYHYNPETGIFKRKISIRGYPAGSIAGSFENGYLRIAIDGQRYKCHRLAWLYVYGKWPQGQIDHKDTIKHHNCISNLRDVTHSGNVQNLIKSKANNSLGILGVSRSGSKFLAQIRLSGESIYLGTFDTTEEAHQAYLEAKRKLHSTCTI